MANTPTQPDLAAQIDTLTSQVATLQNLVYSLQNQQTNPASNLPQVTQTSINTSIPLVSQVTVLSQKPGPTGIQVVVGFTEPSGPSTDQIASYNVWVALGTNTPAVIASVEQAPVTFTVSGVTSSVTAIVGIQTVMKDAATVPFNLCPTATMNLSITSAGVSNQHVSLLTMTANAYAAVGTPVSITSAGTYLVLVGVTAGNHNTSTNTTLICNLYQNGVALSPTFTVFVAILGSQNTISSNVGFYLVPCNAGDSLQLQINPNTVGPFDFDIRIATVKQFAV
jgi:hypothetical protein